MRLICGTLYQKSLKPLLEGLRRVTETEREFLAVPLV